MKEYVNVVELRILESLKPVFDVSSYKNIEIFISIHEKSFIKYEDENKEVQTKFITVHEGNDIFNNLKSNQFEFPSFVKSLKIKLPSQNDLSFEVSYTPVLDLTNT